MQPYSSEQDGAERARSAFSEGEAEFLAENMLGRLATVSTSGQPHVVPVAYRFDGDSIFFGGWNLEESLKFRNIVNNRRVAFVVDEIISTRPWRVRGVEVRGDAERYLQDGSSTTVRITPRTVRSWGLGAR